MENIKFPIANPNIEQVFDSFLDEISQKYKRDAVNKYRNIIQLFKISMNNYGHQTLSKEETELFDRLYNAEGDAHREFVQIFGPDKIPENIGEFLGYFMVRKVVCGKRLLKSAGTVTKKLGKWLVAKGYISKEDSSATVDLATEAVTELPAAEELAEMLYSYAESHQISKWTDEVDDYLTVERVNPGKIYFSAPEDVEDEIIILSLPKRITNKCKVGWNISLFLGKTEKGWKIIESGGVYAL
jgi:hypothetical protein